MVTNNTNGPRAIVSSAGQIKGTINSNQILNASLVMPEIIGYTYHAGNGIVIDNSYISIDELIIDCGNSTTVV